MMTKRKVTTMKNEIENILNCNISDKQYKEACSYAKRKQQYIYKTEHRAEVLKSRYLIKLIIEFIKQFEISAITIKVNEFYNKEKEHLHKQGTPQPSLL